VGERHMAESDWSIYVITYMRWVAYVIAYTCWTAYVITYIR